MVYKGFRLGMLLQIAVGPVCLFIIQTAAALGFWPAMSGVLGVVLIDGVYILAALLGLGALIGRSKRIKQAIKYFGMIVLVIFGVSTIASAFGVNLLGGLRFSFGQSTNSIFVKVLLLTLSNPLTILFWAGVFSAKLTEGEMRQKDMYLFGLGAVLATLTFLTAAAVLGSFLNAFLNPDMIKLLNIIVGAALITFGIKIILKKEDRPLHSS